MTYDEVQRRFEYHEPTPERQRLHEGLGDIVKNFVYLADEAVGGEESREMSLFYTNLEQAAFWLQAHVARNK